MTASSQSPVIVPQHKFAPLGAGHACVLQIAAQLAGSAVNFSGHAMSSAHRWRQGWCCLAASSLGRLGRDQPLRLHRCMKIRSQASAKDWHTCT